MALLSILDRITLASDFGFPSKYLNKLFILLMFL
jgi:hypothetical protein